MTEQASLIEELRAKGKRQNKTTRVSGHQESVAYVLLCFPRLL